MYLKNNFQFSKNMHQTKKGILIGGLIGIFVGLIFMFPLFGKGGIFSKENEVPGEYFSVWSLSGRIYVVPQNVKDCADARGGLGYMDQSLRQGINDFTLEECLSNPQKFMFFKRIQGGDGGYISLTEYIKSRVIYVVPFIILFSLVGAIIGRFLKKKEIAV